MKPYINRAAINKNQFRSAGISVLSYLAHPLNDADMYWAKVYHQNRLVDQFTITCSEKCSEKQANIDLAGFHARRSIDRGQKAFELSCGGYALFYDSTGDVDYHVRLEKASEVKRPTVVFDSKKLDKGDIYAVSLLRPGVYQGINLKNKTEFKVDVLYPETKDLKKKQETPSTVNIEVTDEGFYPKSVKITPGQGLVFQIKGACNLELDLKKAYEKENAFERELKKDRKSKKIRKRIRWENPDRSSKK